jgi:hypothetical protein
MSELCRPENSGKAMTAHGSLELVKLEILMLILTQKNLFIPHGKKSFVNSCRNRAFENITWKLKK